MSQATITLETMKADHHAWSDARAAWRRDIERWQAEHAAAVARLSEMEKIMRDRFEPVAEHARALEQSEAASADHDRHIAEYLAGKSKEPQDILANRHQEQAAVFAHQQDAHERIANHHGAVMAQLERLEAALGAAM
jgi:hypothetical protein